MKTKVKKPNVVTDTFEQVAETGLGAMKKAPKAVAQTFNPADALPESHGAQQDNAVKKVQTELEKKGDNHTPLNFDQLQKQYEAQDKQKQDNLRQRLFKLVKEGEENVYETKKKKEEEKKYQEEQESEEKKKKAREQQPGGELPRGKQRRSVFSHKKVAKQQHTELRPSAGQG